MHPCTQVAKFGQIFKWCGKEFMSLYIHMHCLRIGGSLPKLYPTISLTSIERTPWRFHLKSSFSSLSVFELELQGFTSILILIIYCKQEEAKPRRIASRSSQITTTRWWIFSNFPSSILSRFSTFLLGWSPTNVGNKIEFLWGKIEENQL